jgi:hypothetical protein
MISSPTPTWLAPHSHFSMREHGRIRVSDGTDWFGFQIRASNLIVHPSLIFALAAEGAGKTAHFAVRIDLDTGEISDVANNSGVIGWLEQDLWPSSDEEYPLLFRWEVEHRGGALIPRLQIGDEEWLYPSVLFPGEAHFTATAGHNLDEAEMSSVFSSGYVWCQDRIKPRIA